MPPQNKNIDGGGSWDDLCREYNRLAKRAGRTDLCACRTSMWNWAGELKWTMHRRWIKPLLSEQHKAWRVQWILMHVDRACNSVPLWWLDLDENTQPADRGRPAHRPHQPKPVRLH